MIHKAIKTTPISCHFWWKWRFVWICGFLTLENSSRNLSSDFCVYLYNTYKYVNIGIPTSFKGYSHI